MRTIKKFTRQLNVTIAIARAEKKKEIQNSRTNLISTGLFIPKINSTAASNDQRLIYF